MMDDPVAAIADMAAAGVAEMAGAITAMLTEIDIAGQAVVAALEGAAHAGDPAGADPAAADLPTNWAAYSHDELYRMLREQADVGNVSEIAAEWSRHADALTGHADTLREQRTALAANWQGTAAERATERIGQVAALIGAIGERAGQVRQAAQESADALALARHTMPPPGQQSLAESGTEPVGASPAGEPASPTGGATFAVGAVFVGGTSMFGADFFANSAKSRAEDVMREYESSLHGSDALIAPRVQGTAGSPSLAGLTSLTTASSVVPSPVGSAGPSGGYPGGSGGGVPWSQLVHGGTAEPERPAGRGPLPPITARPALHSALNQLHAAGRAPGGVGAMGFAPPSAAVPRADGDKEHKRQQPNVTKGLFTDERTPSKPIIGT